MRREIFRRGFVPSTSWSWISLSTENSFAEQWITTLIHILMKHIVNRTLSVVVIFSFLGCATSQSTQHKKETTASLLSQAPTSHTDNAFYLYTESLFRRKGGDLDGALQLLKQAIIKDPDSMYLKRELVQLYWQLKDTKNAMIVIEELISQAPEDVDNLILYARINHMIKKLDIAKSAYEKVLSLAPEHKGIYLILGGIYSDEGKLDFALQIYHKLIKEFPDYFAGYFVLGQTYAMRGNFYKAEASFLKALELEPKLDDARYELINLYKTYVKDDIVITIKPGDTITKICQTLYNGYDDTIKKAIVAANPHINDVDEIHVGQQVVFPRLSLKDDKGRHIGDKFKIIKYYKEILSQYPDDIRAAMGLGYFHYEMGNKKEAEKIFKNLGRRSQTDHDVIDFVVRYYLDEKEYDAAVVIMEGMAKGAVDKEEINYILSLAYYGKNDRSNALACLLKIPSDSKFFDKVVDHVYYLYSEEGEIKEAIDFLNQAISAKPENSDFRLYLGKLYEETEEYHKAQHVLEKGIALDPENPKLHFLLGIIFDKAGKKKDAISMMKEVIRISPKDATALNYLGYTYADMGENLDEAKALVEKALEYKPNDGYITDSLGWIYYKKGDYKKALEVLLKAVELVPDDPTILEHLGDIYLRLNNRKEALEMYQRSLKNTQDQTEPIQKKIQDLIDEGL